MTELLIFATYILQGLGVLGVLAALAMLVRICEDDRYAEDQVSDLDTRKAA